MPAEVTVEDRKVKVTSNGQVLYDSESGTENPMAAQFAQAAQVIGKKVVITVDTDGRAGKKLEGDAEAIKRMKYVAEQGIFPVIWKGQSGLKVGDTWEIETEMSAMESLELKTPAKFKTTYKVLGGALVDGVYCVEIETAMTGKAANLEATTEQSGMQMQLKIPSMVFSMKGRAYYDPAQNRVVFADQKGTVEIEASGDVAGAGNLDLKVSVDTHNVLRYNVPW